MEEYELASPKKQLIIFIFFLDLFLFLLFPLSLSTLSDMPIYVTFVSLIHWYFQTKLTGSIWKLTLTIYF